MDDSSYQQFDLGFIETFVSQPCFDLVEDMHIVLDPYVMHTAMRS